MTKITNIIKTLFSILLSTLVLFSLIEIIARLTYPEFSGQIHSATKTLGVNYHLASPTPIRTPFKGASINLEKPMIIVIGDSISHGYGMAYEDIYWVRLQRMMQMELGSKAPEFVSLSYYGNDLQDSIIQLEKFIAQHKKAIVKEIVYQFNFNDIVPEAYGRQALQETYQVKKSASTSTVEKDNKKEVQNTAELSSYSDVNWSKKFAIWRSEYINYSVFLRVAQHFAGKLVRKTSGECGVRDLNALGPYTWTYGSEKYAEESDVLWKNFDLALEHLKKLADVNNAKLMIVISPLLFDIDTKGIHPQYNYLNYDFKCATIKPRERLAKIAQDLNITLLDPTQYIQRSFDSRVQEGNFTPFFFTADENHITPTAASLMADYLYVEGFKNFPH